MGDDEVFNHLRKLFPREKYKLDDVTTGIKDGSIIVDKQGIANILKRSLHDETIVEVELNFLSRVFFCRILDNPPDPIEIETEELSAVIAPPVSTAAYVKGSYLDQGDYAGRFGN